MRRVTRIWNHFVGRASDVSSTRTLPYQGVLTWLNDLVFLTADLLFIPEILSGLLWLLGNRGRKLDPAEKELLVPIFKDSVDYGKVRLHSNMPKFVGRWAHAFVLFNMINFRSKISVDVLVHEMVHIWQYQRYGSAYIGRALMAQNSKEGYDYGGVEELFAGMTAGKALVDFNFEQQGDIVQDAYLQSKGVRGINNQMYAAVYLYYTNQLKD